MTLDFIKRRKLGSFVEAMYVEEENDRAIA